jgi:hypothetical protein
MAKWKERGSPIQAMVIAMVHADYLVRQARAPGTTTGLILALDMNNGRMVISSEISPKADVASIKEL